MESLGPKFITLHGPSHSLFLTLCLLYAVLAAGTRAGLRFLLRLLPMQCHIYPDSGISSIHMRCTYDFRYDPFSFVRVYSTAHDGPEDRRTWTILQTKYMGLVVEDRPIAQKGEDEP